MNDGVAAVRLSNERGGKKKRNYIDERNPFLIYALAGDKKDHTRLPVMARDKPIYAVHSGPARSPVLPRWLR
jgi:hypothetical protein